MPHEYTCKECGGTFESPGTVEEAEEEAEKVFGFIPIGSDRVEVCDECYEKLMVEIRAMGLDPTGRDN